MRLRCLEPNSFFLFYDGIIIIGHISRDIWIKTEFLNESPTSSFEASMTQLMQEIDRKGIKEPELNTAAISEFNICHNGDIFFVIQGLWLVYWKYTLQGLGWDIRLPNTLEENRQ